MDLFLATQNGVWLVQDNAGSWQAEPRGLDGRIVTSIIARENVILAGTTDGLYRSADLGTTWTTQSQGLTESHVRWLAYHPDISDREFAGTEPAAIFVSDDGGDSWQERPEVSKLRDQFGWWLPYSSEAGCVRGFAFHGSHLYAAVEVGGLLYSADGGNSWQLVPGSSGQPRFGSPPEGFIHPDVHSIEVHPSDPYLLFAPTGGGFFSSVDGGCRWEALYPDCYVRAVWLNPTNSQEMVLGPADDSSGKNGRIEHSIDGGNSWQPLTAAQSRSMVERFVPIDNALCAVMSNGELWHSPLPQQAWASILPNSTGVNAACTMA